MIIVPKYISFVEWANNLLIDFPTLNIPVVNESTDWKEWVNRLIDENKFSGIPLPDLFPEWNIWAEYFLNNV